MPLLSSDLVNRYATGMSVPQANRFTPQMQATATAPTASTAPSAGFWDSNPYDGPGDPQLAAPSAPLVQTGGGQYDLAAVSGEGFMRPWTEAFQERTPEQMRADPAYQFRMGEGEQAIERSAAAKGTLLSGSTLKDLMAWGQGLASEEFDKMYNRDLGQYRQAFDIYNTNTGNQFNRLSSLAGLGQNANSQNLSAGLNFGANAGNNIMGAGNATAAGQAASGAAWGGALGQLGNLGSDAWMRYANSRPQPYGGSFGTQQMAGYGVTPNMMPQAPPSAGYAGGVP